MAGLLSWWFPYPTFVITPYSTVFFYLQRVSEHCRTYLSLGDSVHYVRRITLAGFGVPSLEFVRLPDYLLISVSIHD